MTSRPCPTPRCPRLQPCTDHPRIPFANAQRTGVHLYQTSRWKRERKAFLAEHPHCNARAAAIGAYLPVGTAVPYATHCDAPSTVVDHVIPHRGDEELFWRQDNWSALCRPHHQAKTGRETRERAKA